MTTQPTGITQPKEYEVMHHAHYIDIQATGSEIQRFDLRKQGTLIKVKSIVGDAVTKALDEPYTIIIAKGTQQYSLNK